MVVLEATAHPAPLFGIVNTLPPSVELGIMLQPLGESVFGVYRCLDIILRLALGDKRFYPKGFVDACRAIRGVSIKASVDLSITIYQSSVMQSVVSEALHAAAVAIYSVKSIRILGCEQISFRYLRGFQSIVREGCGRFLDVGIFASKKDKDH